MSQVIHHNSKGDVTRTVPKGKGKPRSSWTLDDDGNYHAYPEPMIVKAQYVTLLPNDKIKREPKGRGRTRTDFIKQASGEWMGHYVKDERSS